ncbi:uncharacterized protein LOC116291729 [Actinia tenebrosa]|uniref:Uncharacterized protein LOC116291729 n=1 Tax=Actinia tenebrosa TaxID=6105 RepID=A0A6P8HIU8_ACTTE|nr:uncharacterized protein LOC116291729 [Actinia tenebrosa]
MDNNKPAVNDPALTIGLVVGLLVLLVIAIILIILIRRRRTPQRLEILYNVKSESNKMVNGAAILIKNPDIKNRSEYKHFENINYDPADPNEPQTPPQEPDDDDSIDHDETTPVIPKGNIDIV